MSDEAEAERLARHRRNQARYRERQRERGRRMVQLHLSPDEIAALDAVKAEHGLKSRAEVIAILAKDLMERKKRSEATS